jgi:hypothetical protein
MVAINGMNKIICHIDYGCRSLSEWIVMISLILIMALIITFIVLSEGTKNG